MSKPIVFVQHTDGKVYAASLTNVFEDGTADVAYRGSWKGWSENVPLTMLTYREEKAKPAPATPPPAAPAPTTPATPAPVGVSASASTEEQKVHEQKVHEQKVHEQKVHEQKMHSLYYRPRVICRGFPHGSCSKSSVHGGFYCANCAMEKREWEMN